MPEPVKIGAVIPADIDIYKGQDLVLDIRWWGDEAKTIPIPISAVASQARVDGVLVLDIGAHCTIDEDGVVHLELLKADTEELPPLAFAKWDMELTARDSGETKKIAGRLRIHQEVTV